MGLTMSVLVSTISYIKKGKLMNKVYAESTSKCLLCGEEYTGNVSYCDETLECAMDDGEHLVMV